MKVLLHMNMPSGGNDGTHQVILNVPNVATLEDLSAHITESQGILMGEHLVFDRDRSGERIWRVRGPLLVNMDHVGKIAVYYEGENETR
jgi:hypothetical protein